MVPVLSLALAATLAAAPQPSPLEGCTASREQRGWSYTCVSRKCSIRITDTPGERGVDRELLEETADMLSRTLDRTSTPGERRRGKLVLAGTEVEVVRSEREGSHVAVAGLVLAGGSRVLICHSARAQEDCDALLRFTAATPFQGGPIAGTVVEKEFPLVLLGAPVRVPSACAGNARAPGEGEVRCGTSKVSWFFGGDLATTTRHMREAEEALEQVNSSGQRGRRRELPCRVGGVEATCHELVVNEGDEYATLVWAFLEVKGRGMVASCVVGGDSADRLPCTLALELPVDPKAEPPTVAGRPVVLPEGCRARSGDGQWLVQCRAGHLFWAAIADEEHARRGMVAYEEQVRKKAAASEAKLESIACTIAGAAGRCHRLRATDPARGITTSLVGWAKVDAEIIFAGCSVDGEDLAAAPCALVFDAK